MKFKIMTLDRRAFSIDFSDLKTVGELKARICRLRGCWVQPEYQRLLYAGRVLDDKKPLRDYCIDERKFLLMLSQKIPSKSIKKCSSSILELKSYRESNTRTFCKEHNIQCIPKLALKDKIMKLGPWKEEDVRRALMISLNNANRAIEYLVKGRTLFPKMITPPSSGLFLSKSHDDLHKNLQKPKDTKLLFKYKNTRFHEMQTSSENISVKWTLQDAIKTSQAPTECDVPKEVKWSLEDEEILVNKSKELFKAKAEKTVRWNIENTGKNKRREVVNDLNQLIEIGFPGKIVFEAYKSCHGNVEEAADLLYEQYIEDNDHLDWAVL